MLSVALVKHEYVRNSYFFCSRGRILPCSNGLVFILRAGNWSLSYFVAVCYVNVAAAKAMFVKRVEGRWKSVWV